jgi:hypothetical protein
VHDLKTRFVMRRFADARRLLTSLRRKRFRTSTFPAIESSSRLPRTISAYVADRGLPQGLKRNCVQQGFGGCERMTVFNHCQGGVVADRTQRVPPLRREHGYSLPDILPSCRTLRHPASPGVFWDLPRVNCCYSRRRATRADIHRTGQICRTVDRPNKQQAMG